MKTATLVIPIVLCVLFIIVPVFELVGLICGLDFVLYNEVAVAWVQTVLAVGSAVAIFIMKPKYEKAGRIFCMLLPPISVLNAICFANSEWKLAVIFAVLWSVSCYAIYIKFVPDSGFKALSAVFTVLFAIAFVLLYIIFGIFFPLVSTANVSESYTSPNGELVAELQTEKSFFSEKAVVEVYKAEPDVRAVIGCYESYPIEIYEGESHEVHTATISWKDNSTLVINDTEYPVVFE